MSILKCNYCFTSVFKLSTKLPLISPFNKTLNTDAKGSLMRDILFAPMQSENHKKPKKVSIIGASGNVGKTVAYQLMIKQICDELVLHSSLNGNLNGIGLDLLDGSSFQTHPKIDVCKDGKKTKDSNLLIICAGVSMKIGQTRLEVLKDNIDIFKKMIPPLAKLSPNAVILVATNPVDIMAYAAWKFSGFPFYRVLGTGTTLDSSRLKIFLSKKLGISPQSINAWMIGEHGDSCVACWSTINVAGTRLKDCKETFGLENDPECLFEFENLTIKQGYLVQKLRGFTSYGIAMCITDLAEAILMDTKTIHPVSTNCDGVYGLKMKSFLSLPAVIGNRGVHQIVNLKLNDAEFKKFKKSASVLDTALNSYNWDGEKKKEKIIIPIAKRVPLRSYVHLK